MRKVILILIILILIIAGGFVAYRKWKEPMQQIITEQVVGEKAPKDTIPHIYLYDICIDSLIPNEFTIRRGETFASILKKNNIDGRRADEIIKSTSRFFDVAMLQTGKKYYTLSSIDSSTVEYIIYQKTLSEAVVFDLKDTCRVYETQKPITLKRKHAVGTITGSLWGAIKESGADPLLALMLSDLYAWTIDFFDLQKGDYFKVIYEQSYVDDTVSVEIASIKGVEFMHKGKVYYAIPMMQDSTQLYFDADGSSLRRKFLKAPLKFSRVTSGFSHGRMHPILKILRPHHGVDYAAPIGTPVYSIGDGEVITAAHQGAGAGRYLIVKHDDIYTSTYMHLSRYAKGVRAGVHVKQGEVIGYVGSSGLSTGAHLDFRIHKNGRAVNPMKLELPPLEPVKPELRSQFEEIKRDIIRELDGLKVD
ncbi:MAG: peptidoglycan DD-metalloendopeptidase family protein [Bacteroidales bacterium]